jgi:hypothetical protein
MLLFPLHLADTKILRSVLTVLFEVQQITFQVKILDVRTVVRR